MFKRVSGTYLLFSSVTIAILFFFILLILVLSYLNYVYMCMDMYFKGESLLRA